jgi:hypothetical protein
MVEYGVNRVYIHGGLYRGRYGTYLGRCGAVKCRISIDGDTVHQRNLWLTSITRLKVVDEDDAKEEADKATNEATEQGKEDSAVVTIPKKELVGMLEKITSMKIEIEMLESKLKQLVIDKD